MRSVARLKPNVSKDSLSVRRRNAQYRAVPVRSVQGAAVRMRGGVPPYARPRIVGRLTRGEGDVLRIDGARDGARYRRTVGSHDGHRICRVGGRLAALGPLARARLGFALSLTDEEHRLIGRAVRGPGEPCDPVRPVRLAAYLERTVLSRHGLSHWPLIL